MSTPKVLFQIMGEELCLRLDWFSRVPLAIGVFGEDVSGLLLAKYPAARVGDVNTPGMSFDLILSHLSSAPLEEVLRVSRQKLLPEGVLLMSTFGLDAFLELRDQIGLPDRMDMHDVGDAMVALGFSDPVMEVMRYTFTYRSVKQMEEELRSHRLIAPNEALDASLLLKNEEGVYPLTIEWVIGHAFAMKAGVQTKAEDGSVRVPISLLRDRQKR